MTKNELEPTNPMMDTYIEMSKKLSPQEFRRWANLTGMWLAPYSYSASQLKDRLLK